MSAEFNIPRHGYCGTFTGLQERLERSDEGINELDVACKDHYIAYRDHKELVRIYKADK